MKSILVTISLGLLLAGCASNNSQPRVHQRGWIGGEYKLACKPKRFTLPMASLGALDFPGSLIRTQQTGVVLTMLGTNTPAALAGLREGDLLLALNHKPVTSLRDFRRTVDRAKPGTLLPVKAWRDSQLLEGKVCVGCEIFRKQEYLSLGLPPITDALKLWPDPGFSLIILGYKPNPGDRKEFASPEQTYARSCNRSYEPHDEDWRTWLVILSLWKEEIIVSQTSAPGQAVVISRQ
jgi:PDZ domain